MALPVGLKETQKFFPLFMDQKLEQKRMKILRSPALKLFGSLKLDKLKMKAFAYLAFPNSVLSVLRKGLSLVEGEPMEHGIITSVTHGAMSVDDYFLCLKRGHAPSAKLSDFLRSSLQSQFPRDSSKAG